MLNVELFNNECEVDSISCLTLNKMYARTDSISPPNIVTTNPIAYTHRVDIHHKNKNLINFKMPNNTL